MTTRKYSSRSQQTTLSGALTSSGTSATVVSGTSLLGGATITAGETFTVVIDPDTALEEIVDITAVSTNTLTIVRGRDGSSGVAHSAGAVVRHMAIGRDYREANQHIENTTTAHGLTIADVTLSTGTGNVSTQMLASNAVTTAKITDLNVTTAKIADSAITSAKIADLTIATGDIADSAITSGKIATGAVGTTKIDDLSITTGKIVDSAITAAKIGADAVTTAKILDSNVTTAKIADSAVTSAKIADGTIVAGDIADGTITSAKIADGTIVAGDIADGAVTSAKILDGTIVNADINTSAQIAYSKLNLTNTIVNADINASAAIALSKLATDPLARANHTGTQTASTISDFNTAVRTNRLDQMAAPTGSVSLNSQKITNLATPTDNTDASTKAYVDTSIANLIAGAPSTLDTLDEIAQALNDTANFSDTVVLKSGSTMTGNLAMGTNKVTGLGTPTTSTDAATKGYVDTAAIAPSNLTGPITSVGPATAIASQTGTGTKFVMDNTPTLITPVLGVATATSINGTTIPSSKTLVATDSTQYVVPSQTGNSGKYLKTDGTTSSWQTVDSLPSQTSNSGKFLTTDGTNPSWAVVAGSLAQPSEPSTPSDGQIWVDTDGSVVGQAMTRWSKAPTGGTTSLTGNDDNSLALSYTVGYEQVYRNGVLLSRGNDYTATNGTSITLTDATITGDIIEVFASAVLAIADVYTQAQSDAKYVLDSLVDAKGDIITATANDTPARLAVGANDTVLTADSSTATGLKWAAPAGGDTFAAGKNKIINGDFAINQRNFTSNTANNTYGFDRWNQLNSGGTVTVTPQTFTPGTAPVTGYEAINFVRIVSASQSNNANYACITQRIEGVRTFANQTATISFWAKASTGTPKIGITLEQGFGATGSTIVTTAITAQTITSSWARYSFTVNVPSVSGKTISGGSDMLGVLIFTSCGTSVTGYSTDVGLQNVTVDFWGVQMEAGSTATTFQTATGTLQGELAACQRYYFRFQNTAAYSTYGTGWAESSSDLNIGIQVPVQMRVTPTSVDFANIQISDRVNTQTPSSLSISSLKSSSLIPYLNISGVSGLTQYRPYEIRNSNNSAGYIGLSAEL